MFELLVVLYCVTAAADAITSSRAIKRGGVEVNPIVVGIFDEHPKPWQFALLKVVGLGPVVAIATFAPEWLATILVGGISFSQAYRAYRNETW